MEKFRVFAYCLSRSCCNGVKMAGSVNKVILLGNVGKDPEIRMTQDGSKLASFSLATSESRKDKNSGERIDKTEWHKIVIFNEHIAEVVEKYVKKGSKVYIEGQLQTRKWTDQQGVERYTTEIVISRFKGELSLLDSRSGGMGNSESGSFGGTEIGENVSLSVDDDIPF